MPRVDHQSVDERVAAGRAARARVPRESHGEWSPAPDRDDPVSLLEEQAASRVPELVPIRNGRMAASPFPFYRGGALIMAADLASTPVSGLEVQACGDAHLSNFGLFASPERQLVFDVNDFDETLPGPWEWDVKRLAASIEIAGRERGFPAKRRRALVRGAVGAYRTAMREFATKGTLEVWYSHATIDRALPRAANVLDRESLAQARKVVEKALTKDSAQALSRLSAVVDGRRQLVSDPPLIVPVDELLTPDEAVQYTEAMRQVIRQARDGLADERRHLLEQYRFSTMARKVVGVGSVGTRAWVLLMIGRDEDDVLLLQGKEAQASVLERYTKPSRYKQHGRRVVEGQKRMQAASDVFLSWTRVESGMDGQPHDYYVRQLHDWKGSWDPAVMNPNGMSIYTQMCAWTLARAHARTGDRIAIASYLGSSDAFDRALAAFAVAYADQNEKDHSALVAAVTEGRVTARSGV
jgi:uncharacterized protein (DUF2252 family)